LGQHGYYTNTGTGLLCLTHRYYDAGTGRFVTHDPIGYKGGINLYGFAGNNPVNESDPNGFSPAGDAAGVVGLIPGPIGEAANLASGLDSLAEGDYVGAALSLGGEVPGLGEFATGAKILRAVNRVRKAKRVAKIAEEAEVITSRAARREAMRKSGIPTSQQPVSQMKTAGGRQYEYGMPKSGGGNRDVVVTQHQADEVHPRPHWESGTAKDRLQNDPLGRRSYFGGKGTPHQKVKVEYD